MTCIVGLEYDGQVYIGGDSLGVAGWESTVRTDEKVFRNGGMVFGFTSSFRMGQLLRYSLKVPDIPERGLDRWMVARFVEEVRTCLADGGYRRKTDEVERGGCFLVGVRGRLYRVESDFQVGRAGSGYDAVGAGADVALGALYVANGADPAKRLRRALAAAEEHNAAVRRPFRVLKA